VVQIFKIFNVFKKNKVASDMGPNQYSMVNRGNNSVQYASLLHPMRFILQFSSLKNFATVIRSSAGFRFGLTLVLFATLSLPVFSWDFIGRKNLIATTRDQQRIPIGSVQFEPRGDGSIAFELAMDHSKFTDHFLSMKEFKCLTGPTEIFCHVPYPYPQPATISARDLSWLEHSLMFLFKLPNEFGAKLWNGVYFRFEATEQGLVGRPQAIDLNRISAPPLISDRPPFGAAFRDDIRPGARWIESLSIE
jgi:hypothetical protein